MIFTLPNCISILRMVGTLCLLGTAPLSTSFFVIYTLTGVTDVLDGWLARRTGTESALGARLDSIADLLFYAVMLGKLLPALLRRFPAALWYVVGAIVLIRLASYGVAAWKYRTFASLHTYLNKLTGAVVFLLPYVLAASAGIAYGWAVCLLALAAAVEEWMIHLCRAEYCADRKSFFDLEGNGDMDA